MTNITSFQDIIGAPNGDKASVLGKFLYFSLANILVEKEALAQLCSDLSIPYSGSKRISVSDAFRSATGDIKDRITVKNPGEHHIYAVYCRDNAHTEDVYSRELVKETLNQRTNQYEKLANIFYDRRDNQFGYDNIGFDADIDPISYCRRAEELFELYQVCANRRQIETICLGYLRMLEATKVSSTGHLYFIPRQHMDKVDTFETFIEQLSAMNQNDNALSVNSFYIILDGYSDGTFRPNEPITRAEFAAIAARFDENAASGSASFSDLSGHWAAGEISKAYQNGWVTGYSDGTFRPDQSITRAEAVTLINRVLERELPEDAELLDEMNVWSDNRDTGKWYYLDIQEATNSHAYTRDKKGKESWVKMRTDPDWTSYED